MTRRRAVGVAVLAVLILTVWTAVLTQDDNAPSNPPLQANAIAAIRVIAPPVPVEVLPPSPPSSSIPTLAESGEDNVERRVRALAGEMAKMWTRDPDRLVETIERASRTAQGASSITLLLAIAHAETNGKILDVSEAGAVGLAQATPVAYLQEEYSGPIFITPDYLIGARAYIMKKPLGDADTIASKLIDSKKPISRAKAKKLLASARELRREGVDDFELLRGHAPDVFFARVENADRHNRKVLDELEKLIAKGSKSEIKGFRDRTRKEYRDLKKLQVVSWSAYQKELITKRDAMLKKEFGGDVATVKKTRAYEAGAYLGRALDQRFSPDTMAEFLVRHLDRKAAEAQKLGVEDERVESYTAALYNGGSPNVRRMLAGLMGSLPETDKYMRKVPATRQRLDTRLAPLADTRQAKAR